MPTISFDIFFDQDIINLTATRSGPVPKIKPEWKVRTAPKLAPKKEEIEPKPGRPAPKIRANLPAAQKAASDAGSTTSSAAPKPKAAAAKPPVKGVPKLPAKAPSVNGASKPAAKAISKPEIK